MVQGQWLCWVVAATACGRTVVQAGCCLPRPCQKCMWQEAHPSTRVFSVHTHPRAYMRFCAKGRGSPAGVTTKGVGTKAGERKVTIPLENGHGGGGGSSPAALQHACFQEMGSTLIFESSHEKRSEPSCACLKCRFTWK